MAENYVQTTEEMSNPMAEASKLVDREECARSLYYVELLQSELKSRKQKNERYSMRGFAKFLGIHPSALCRTLAGRQGLSMASCLRILGRLALSPEQKWKFLVSVCEQQVMGRASNMMSQFDNRIDGFGSTDLSWEMQPGHA